MFVAAIRDPSTSSSTANEDAEEVLIITQDPAYRRMNSTNSDIDSDGLAVDCDLSPYAMAKLGQEPHLSSLIGRTSDLEHSPGLIVQLHPKVSSHTVRGDTSLRLMTLLECSFPRRLPFHMVCSIYFLIISPWHVFVNVH
jgi:hypothetical protein